MSDLIKHNYDERALQLIKEGKFNLSEYNLCNSNVDAKLTATNGDNMEACITADVPILALSKKYMGDNHVRRMIQRLISDAIENMNVARNMKDSQIEFAVNAVIANYYYLKPTEIKHALYSGIIGKYGTSYEKLDVQVICGWLDTYCEKRAAYFEQASQKKHYENKRDPLPTTTSEMQAIYKAMNEKALREKEAKEKAQKEKETAQASFEAEKQRKIKEAMQALQIEPPKLEIEANPFGFYLDMDILKGE